MKIILSIDGGGIRGIVPAIILDYIEKKIQEINNDPRIKIGSLIDLVAGTSTGSIVGCMMILPAEKSKNFPKYHMEEISKMYIDMGPGVFKKNFWHSLKNMWGLFGPIFPSSNIEDPLYQMMGHTKMKDLVKPCLFTGYDINKRIVNIYTNKDENEKYADYYIKDIIRGSTSIPAYFKPAYFRDGTDIHTIVDGGVFANNPSLVALIEASKTKFNDKPSKKINPGEALVISIGTGDSNKKKFPYNKAKKFGIIKWLMPIIDVLLSASNDTVTHEMKKLYELIDCPDNFIRINPKLIHSTSPSTDASKENILNLVKDAEDYIAQNQDMLDNLSERISKMNYLIPS
jgi:patatin-like phospholipase/acyl hydrolase